MIINQIPYGLIYRANNLISGKSYIGKTIQTLKKRISGQSRLGIPHSKEVCKEMSNTRKIENNPNFKHGRYCTQRFCKCGKKLSPTAKMCIKCFNFFRRKDIWQS
jgi:hypothetical protein